MLDVVAVTVTHNDAKYLVRCVSALTNQTYAVNKIVIVDNCSNDENREILKNIDAKNAEILYLDDNKGGAGGFEIGLRYAFENYAADWYFIMDADAHPDGFCLEKLLNHVNDVPKIGYLAPVIKGDTLGKIQLFHHKRLSTLLDRDLQVIDSIDGKGLTQYIEADAFVGTLISKSAIEKIGFPDGELFIYGDDLEYTYRITREFIALLVLDAVIYHRDQLNEKNEHIPNNWWKDYYMYRNRILFINKYQKSFYKKMLGVILVKIRCIKHIIAGSVAIKDKNLRKIHRQLLIAAIQDGQRGKSGKSLDPQKFNEMICGYE